MRIAKSSSVVAGSRGTLHARNVRSAFGARGGGSGDGMAAALVGTGDTRRGRRVDGHDSLRPPFDLDPKLGIHRGHDVAAGRGFAALDRADGGLLHRST